MFLEHSHPLHIGSHPAISHTIRQSIFCYPLLLTFPVSLLLPFRDILLNLLNKAFNISAYTCGLLAKFSIFHPTFHVSLKKLYSESDTLSKIHWVSSVTVLISFASYFTQVYFLKERLVWEKTNDKDTKILGYWLYDNFLHW